MLFFVKFSIISMISGVSSNSEESTWPATVLEKTPANIRLDEGVLKTLWRRQTSWSRRIFALALSQQTFVLVKTYWRRIQDVFSVTFLCLPRRLEDTIRKTSYKHVLKTSWRRLGRRFKDVLKTPWRSFRKTAWRRLEDVLERTYCKYVLKGSWRRLEEVLEGEKCYTEDVSRRLGKKKCLQGCLQKTSSRRICNTFFLKRLQDVFLKLRQGVFKTSSKRLPRRLQDVFKTCL